MVTTSVNFDKPGKHQGVLQAPYSHNLSGWANVSRTHDRTRPFESLPTHNDAAPDDGRTSSWNLGFIGPKAGTQFEEFSSRPLSPSGRNGFAPGRVMGLPG
jgi:hypothetical protein